MNAFLFSLFCRPLYILMRLHIRSNHFNLQIIPIKAFGNHSLTYNSCLRRPTGHRTPILEIVNVNTRP